MFIRPLIFLLLSCAPQLAFAQEDDTIQYIQGLPQAGTDSSLYDDASLIAPPAHYKRIAADQVAGKVVKELNGDELFEGWQKEDIYYDPKTKLYWINFTDSTSVKSYGFAEDGARVSVKERSFN